MYFYFPIFYEKPARSIAACRLLLRLLFAHVKTAANCHIALCLRSLRCRSGRCLTSGLRSTSVIAGRVVYTPFRSLLDACHRHAATLALSPPRSYRLVGKCPRIRPSELARLCVHLIAFIVNFHAALGAAPPRMKARIAPCLRHSRNPAPKYSHFPLPGGNSCSYLGAIKCADTGSSKLAPAPAHLIAFIVK